MCWSDTSRRTTKLNGRKFTDYLRQANHPVSQRVCGFAVIDSVKFAARSNQAGSSGRAGRPRQYLAASDSGKSSGSGCSGGGGVCSG